jgi:hypothetical protein
VGALLNGTLPVKLLAPCQSSCWVPPAALLLLLPFLLSLLLLAPGRRAPEAGPPPVSAHGGDSSQHDALRLSYGMEGLVAMQLHIAAEG